MNSIAARSVIIQTSCESVPSTPCWFGEVALIIEHLRKQGVLTKICERVRLARRRFGHYEVIDFLAVLFGYAISGERTLEAFYERLQPFAVPFMSLFDRDQLPARSTLSRFLAALTMEPVEALRSLFLDDLLARPLTKERQRGELLDRAGGQWEVFDIDGTELRQPANVPYRRRRICLPSSVGSMRSVLLATAGASVGKSSARAPSFRKPTPISGSAVSATEATGRTGRNWHAHWKPSVASWLRTVCLKHAPCCDW